MRTARTNTMERSILTRGERPFVREFFVEAKHEKLVQSKEFHEVPVVLSTNKDLFLKFLDDPKSVVRTKSISSNLLPNNHYEN